MSWIGIVAISFQTLNSFSSEGIPSLVAKLVIHQQQRIISESGPPRHRHLRRMRMCGCRLYRPPRSCKRVRPKPYICDLSLNMSPQMIDLSIGTAANRTMTKPLGAPDTFLAPRHSSRSSRHGQRS